MSIFLVSVKLRLRKKSKIVLCLRGSEDTRGLFTDIYRVYLVVRDWNRQLKYNTHILILFNIATSVAKSKDALHAPQQFVYTCCAK